MLVNFILFCIIYLIIGFGSAKAVGRAVPEFSDFGSRFVVLGFWPFALICMCLFGDWND